MSCPLTLMARKYSNAPQSNFDISPRWLATNNKLIYTVIFIVVMLGLMYRMITNNLNFPSIQPSALFNKLLFRICSCGISQTPQVPGFPDD